MPLSPTWWVDESPITAGLKPLDRLVYFTLCRFANGKTQECYPSLSAIMEQTGMSRHGIQDALKHLETAGIIKADARDHRPYLFTLPYRVRETSTPQDTTSTPQVLVTSTPQVLVTSTPQVLASQTSTCGDTTSTCGDTTSTCGVPEPTLRTHTKNPQENTAETPPSPPVFGRPIPTQAKKTREKKIEVPQPYTEDFERVWKEYPLKEEKRPAFNAFQRVRQRFPHLTIDDLVLAIQAYIAYKTANSWIDKITKLRVFAYKRMHNWLDDDGFYDDYTIATPPTASAGAQRQTYVEPEYLKNLVPPMYAEQRKQVTK